ncbi:MAG: hypothetical protein LUG56_05250 [Lachnospiraceae bacterium]|nr:hypothetical protein [Lachnospiraceae bacterium]
MKEMKVIPVSFQQEFSERTPPSDPGDQQFQIQPEKVKESKQCSSFKYQRVKADMSAKNETFSYRHIKDVYTIVLFENSPSECKAFPDTYIHHGNVRFNSGLKIHMPQDFIYIPLDISVRFCTIEV